MKRGHSTVSWLLKKGNSVKITCQKNIEVGSDIHTGKHKFETITFNKITYPCRLF